MDGKTFLSEELPKLFKILQGTDVRELEIEEGDIRVRLHRREFSADAVPSRVSDFGEDVSSDAPTSVMVRASVVGTFYRAGKPGMAPLVSEGSRVDESTVIGIIEALHVLTDVEARHAGVVTAVLATDGQPVEYNQPLLEIRPHG